jgi:hypothetical protein
MAGRQLSISLTQAIQGYPVAERSIVRIAEAQGLFVGRNRLPQVRCAIAALQCAVGVTQIRVDARVRDCANSNE